VKQLEFQLFSGGVMQIPCDTLIVPLPSDERPLRGEAGLVDWRVCGAISEQLVSGYVTAKRGEVVLLPAPRPLAATRLLLVGLGPGRRLQGKGLQRAISLACDKILSLRAGLGLVALPGIVDFALDAPPIVRGCCASLARVRGDARLQVAFASGLERARTLEAALAGLGNLAPEKGIDVSLEWPEAEVQPAGAPPT
jgi:hypothetical protein